jgi:hypothetical protein
MNSFLQYLKELNKFLAWFKAIHPGPFEKYKHNIDMPLTKGGRVNIIFLMNQFLAGFSEQQFVP